MTAENTRESVEKVLTDALVEFGLDHSEISLDASLVDLDLSSLDMVELMAITREDFGVVLQGPELVDCRTLGDVVDLIAARSDGHVPATEGADSTDGAPSANDT